MKLSDAVLDDLKNAPKPNLVKALICSEGVPAIRLHTQPGQEIICESRSHIVDWEMAMAASFSGCQLRTVTAERGIVIHGAWYVSEDIIGRCGMLGRSEGCLAVSSASLDEVLTRLGPGRFIYAGKA